MEAEVVDEDLLDKPEKTAPALASPRMRPAQWLPCVILLVCVGLVFGAHAIYERNAPAHEAAAAKRAHARAIARRRAIAADAMCPRTHVFPQEDGCPTLGGCLRLRGRDANATTRLLRVTVGWTFGALLDLHDAERARTATDEHLTWRFGAAPSFVRGFAAAEDAVEAQARARLPRGRAHPSERLQHDLSLGLLTACCLTRREMAELRRGVDAWARRQDGLWLPVRVARVDCWHERNASVAIGAVVDAITAPALQDLVHDLQHELRGRRVPLVLADSKARPFHVPVLSFYSHTQPNADAWLRQVGRAVAAVGENVAMETTIRKPPAMGRVKEIHGDSYWR